MNILNFKNVTTIDLKVIIKWLTTLMQYIYDGLKGGFLTLP